MKKESLKKLVIIISIIVGMVALTTVQTFAVEDPFGDDDEGEVIDFGNQSGSNTENKDSEDKESENKDTSISGSIVGGNSNGSENANGNGNSADKVKEEVDNTKLPHAGIGNENVIVALMIVFGIVAIFAYIKLRSYKNI